MWRSDQIRLAIDAQKEAAIWHARAEQARWEWDIFLFSGYLSQWVRFKKHARNHAARARELMGIDDDARNG